MSVTKTVGQNIRRMRRARDISQENLALEAGSERSYLSMIERGKANPSVEMLARIARALDVEVIDFFKEREGEA
ncbi:MAG: helix-turn-helix domain-containing protein [Alphaproteobacteria bacterium]